MGWKIQRNVARYGQGNWNNFVKKVRTTTAEEAMRVAFADPEITFFFFCRQPIILDREPAAKYGPFEAGDAVFFKGKPWYGSAPQCDSYEKTAVSTIYINPTDNQQFKDVSSYVLADGTPAIDVVCIFAANYTTNEIQMLRANNNSPPTQKQFNGNIENVLGSGLVKMLQNKCMTVLLTIMGAQTSTGWSKFADQSTAQEFVDYLKSDVVIPYGLDGIDIDDEYSVGSPVQNSLAMVTTLMKQSMPSKLITKALWSDHFAFEANWNGNTLGGNLNYGWEMTYYGGDANSRLSFYTLHGMSRNQLCLGFSAEERFSGNWKEVGPQAHQTVSNGYAGGMMFAYENEPASIYLMQHMVDAMDGLGNWNKIGSGKLEKKGIRKRNKNSNRRRCTIM